MDGHHSAFLLRYEHHRRGQWVYTTARLLKKPVSVISMLRLCHCVFMLTNDVEP